MPYDTSQLNTFQACPERYRLRYVEALQRVKEEAEDQPKKFGKALHVGLATWYRQARQALPCGAADVADSFLALFPKALTEAQTLYTPEHGLAVLQQYLQQYGVPDQSLKVLAVEQPSTILLPEIGGDCSKNLTPFLVKHDLIVQQDSGIWVMEHKSTASPKAFTDSWWAQFEPNSQLSAQIAACQEVYGECAGVILNGIAFSYGVRKGFVVEFQRQTFHRTAEQLEDWKQNTIQVIERLNEPRLTGSQWEKNEAQCGWCEFRELCISCGSQGVREAMYARVANPLAYQEVSDGGVVPHV